MKRIVFTVTNDLTYDQRMDRISRSLTKAGYQVVLIGFTKSNSVPLSPKPYHQIRLNLIFQKGKFFYLEYNFRLFWFLLTGKYDIYGAVDLDTILPNFLVAGLKRKICVHDAHEYFTELPEINHRPFIKKCWEFLARIVLPRIQYNYTVCQSIARELSDKYQVHYEVIRNVPVAAPLVEAKHSEKPEIFVYQGALNKGRGIEQLMMAMDKIAATLWIIGEGDLSEHLRNLHATLEWKEKIVFLGYKLPDELKKITGVAYAGINLISMEGKSYYYSLSNKFFDYIQAGIPQITMNYPEYEALNNTYHISINISDLSVENIRQAMYLLLNDKNLYQTLKLNTKKAATDLTWQNEEKVLLSFYDRIRS